MEKNRVSIIGIVHYLPPSVFVERDGGGPYYTLHLEYDNNDAQTVFATPDGKIVISNNYKEITQNIEDISELLPYISDETITRAVLS